jgi:hypothetical protein
VVTCKAAGATVIERAWVAVWVGEDESVACTLKAEVPDEVGVPVIAPVEAFRLNPGGSAPELTFQEYGVVPPAAATLEL